MLKFYVLLGQSRLEMLYINLINYIDFKNNQILKDEDKFLVKKSRLKKYLENNIIEIYSNTSKYHNCDY